jgi:hypothetical protein
MFFTSILLTLIAFKTFIVIILALILYTTIIGIILKIFRYNRQHDEMLIELTGKDLSFENHNEEMNIIL